MSWLSDFLQGWGQQSNTPSGGFNSIENLDWGSPGGYYKEPTKGIDWYGGFKDFAKEIAPGVGAAAAGAGIQAFMPGTPSRVMQVDPRTATGTAAENLRLGAAGQAASKLNASFTDPYGALTPEEQARVKKTTRSADAARGMLETGGSAVREREALSAENTARQRELYGNVGNLTQGYAPRSVNVIPGQESPWARILTAALAPSIGKGFGSALQRWWV